jgi:hypothetical protein
MRQFTGWSTYLNITQIWLVIICCYYEVWALRDNLHKGVCCYYSCHDNAVINEHEDADEEFLTLWNNICLTLYMYEFYKTQCSYKVDVKSYVRLHNIKLYFSLMKQR